MVATIEALTHAATLYHPEKMKDPALAEEITQLVVRYLGT